MAVTLLDASGNRVSDAQVRVSLVMPAMPSMGMPEMTNASSLSWTGSQYTGTANMAMSGHWNVIVEAHRGNQFLAKYSSFLEAR